MTLFVLFFMTRSDHVGNMSAWEALFCKTQDLDKEKSGPCDVYRLSVKHEVTLIKARYK